MPASAFCSVLLSSLACDLFCVVCLLAVLGALCPAHLFCECLCFFLVSIGFVPALHCRYVVVLQQALCALTPYLAGSHALFPCVSYCTVVLWPCAQVGDSCCQAGRSQGLCIRGTDSLPTLCGLPSFPLHAEARRDLPHGEFDNRVGGCPVGRSC